jgi:AmmeMemoRadiSam system protein A
VPDGACRGSVLLSIAREAIADGLDDVIRWDRPEPWLREHGASFVTLRLAGELRGCVGTVDPHRGLGEDVASNARAAAYRDARFAPLTPGEGNLLQVEVSLLSPRCALDVDNEDEAAAALRPGIDGVVLEFAEVRATFLPQVWDNLPDPIDFLAELRRKARLPARFWHPDMKISRYTVEKYLSPRSGAWDR